MVGLLMLSWQDIEGIYSGSKEIHVAPGLVDSSLPCYCLSSRAQHTPAEGRSLPMDLRPLSIGGYFLDPSEVQPFKHLADSQVCFASNMKTSFKVA